MSVTIRLARIGRKNSPAFKIVVSNTRDKRNGRYVDVLGHYNPSVKPVDFAFDEEKYIDWKHKGALSTKAVEALRDGTYEHISYNPNVTEETGKDAKPQEQKQEQEQNQDQSNSQKTNKENTQKNDESSEKKPDSDKTENTKKDEG